MQSCTFTFTFNCHLRNTHHHRSRGETPWRAQTNTTHVIYKFHVVNHFTVEKHNTRYHAGYMYLDGSSRYTQIQAGYMRNVFKIHEGYIRDTCLRPFSYAAPGQTYNTYQVLTPGGYSIIARKGRFEKTHGF